MEVYNKHALHFPRLLENPGAYIEYCEQQSKKTNKSWDPWMSGGDGKPHPYGELWTFSDTDDESTRLLDAYDKALILSVQRFLEHTGVSLDKQQLAIDAISNSRPRAMAVKRYYVGEELGPHPDADPNGDLNKLPLTVSMYFNEGYVGGLLGFEDGSKIELTSGSVVIFPATYLHESTTVTSGIKYVSNEVIVLNKSDLGVEVL